MLKIPLYTQSLVLTTLGNQSVANAGVEFVKGANERNKFFEKINKQHYMTTKSGRTKQRTNNLGDELIWG